LRVAQHDADPARDAYFLEPLFGWLRPAFISRFTA
jgi:hypothetical protein